MTEATGLPIVQTATAVEPPKDGNSPPQVTQVSQGVKAGIKSSEAWVTFIVLALAGLISSGLVGAMTPTGKAIVFASGALKAMFYTWSRTQVKTAASILALLIMSNAVMSSGCGPSARTKTIRAALITVNAAEAGFVALNKETESKLVESASSYEGGEKALQDWRKKRGSGEDAIVGAYRAIAVAASFDDDVTIQSMMTALAVLRQQLTAMGVTL